MGAGRLREVGMLMAGQAATHLDDFPPPSHVCLCRDPSVGLDVFEGLAGFGQVLYHRADFERLIPHRLLKPLALEVFPKTEEPRHLRGRPEVLRIPEPGVEPVESNLARDMAEARAHLREIAGGFGHLEKRS